MAQDWNDNSKDSFPSRSRGDKDERYPASGRIYDEYDRDRDYRYGGQSRSSSSSSKKDRRGHRDGRSRSYSRSRSRTRSRTRSRSRSPSSSYRHSNRDRHRRRPSRSTSRSRSRSRSRDRYNPEYGYSRSPRPDDEYHYRDRRSAEDAPPNATLVVKGLPPEWDEPMMWTLMTQQGFQPKDIRILKRRDTGQGRGFGFVEFIDVEEATRWMEMTQGRLKVDDRYWADIQYSKAPHATSAVNLAPANALAAILAQRGGDWICAKCGTNNFRKRDMCFKCNLKREESETMSGDGYSEIGVVPCDTLLLRNLPADIEEDTILSHLKSVTALGVVRIVVARDPSTDASRGYAYVQMANANEATQLLTALTTLTVLNIDGHDISVTYSKYPLTIVLTGTNLTQGTPGAASWSAAASVPGGGLSGLPGVTQTDVTNAAAAVAQSAIKKAHVMRHVAAQQVQAAQLAHLRAATMFVPTSALLLQHQQILAAQALHEMATVQLLQEHVSRQAATLTDLGTVQTPHGELPRYPVPEVQKFQLDTTTGFYYDATTGLHYDATSQYFYNSETRQYLYWDASYQTYLPAPASEGESSKSSDGQQTSTEPDKEAAKATAAVSTASSTTASSAAPSSSAGDGTSEAIPEKKKEVKEKKEKVSVAKKIQKDMEKWAKQLNQRKEAQAPKPVVNFAVASGAGEPAAAKSTTLSTPSTEEKSFGSADAAFLILERTGAPGFKGLVSYDGGGDSDDEQAKIPVSAQKRKIDESDITDWTKMACLLCRRQFPDKDVLTKHLQFSDLHKKNLVARMQQSDDSGGHAGGGMQYRDRAKERREKFSADEEKRGKPNYYDPAGSSSKELYQSTDFDVSGGASSSSSQMNIGNKLLKSMGWQEGQGLGRANQGIVDPITSQRRVQGAGLGASGSVLTTPASASYKDHVKAALRQKFYQDLS